MAVTDQSSFIAMLAGAENLAYIKATLNSKASGSFQSLWAATGFPVAGSAPGGGISGEVPTRTTPGAILFSSPGALTAYLCRLTFGAGAAGTFFLADRLFHSTGLVGNVTTVQPVNSVSFSARNPSFVGNQLFIEIYNGYGAVSGNITVLYTNQAGQTGRSSTISAVSTPVVGQMMWVPLQAGDTGVQSIQSIQFSALGASAGSIGLTVLRIVDSSSIVTVNTGISKGPFDLGISSVDGNACLFFFAMTAGSATGQICGSVSVGKG